MTVKVYEENVLANELCIVRMYIPDRSVSNKGTDVWSLYKPAHWPDSERTFAYIEAYTACSQISCIFPEVEFSIYKVLTKDSKQVPVPIVTFNPRME